MTKYNGNIGNLLQGVSQQARRDRRQEQVGAMTNCYASVTNGTGKRPGTAAGRYSGFVHYGTGLYCLVSPQARRRSLCTLA